MKGPGLKPPQEGRFRREVIGPTECPIMRRWTLASTRWGKLLVHHFLPNADDRATHDHPASFVTLVVRGGYDDRVPCKACDGSGHRIGIDRTERIAYKAARVEDCQACHGLGTRVGDRMRPGMVRFRPAEHRHRARVGPNGCWTLVLMFPKRREWGFWTNGIWMPWREHERRFGFGMRCPTTEEEARGA